MSVAQPSRTCGDPNRREFRLDFLIEDDSEHHGTLNCASTSARVGLFGLSTFFLRRSSSSGLIVPSRLSYNAGSRTGVTRAMTCPSLSHNSTGCVRFSRVLWMFSSTTIFVMTQLLVSGGSILPESVIEPKLRRCQQRPRQVAVG